MRTAALAHREVMSEPTPRVIFKKVTENTIDFDLVCFVDDIDAAGRVSSDLYFEIFRRPAQGRHRRLRRLPPAPEPEEAGRRSPEGGGGRG